MPPFDAAAEPACRCTREGVAARNLVKTLVALRQRGYTHGSEAIRTAGAASNAPCERYWR